MPLQLGLGSPSLGCGGPWDLKAGTICLLSGSAPDKLSLKGRVFRVQNSFSFLGRFPCSLPSLGTNPCLGACAASCSSIWSASVCGCGAAGKRAELPSWARHTPIIGTVLQLTGVPAVWTINMQRSRCAAAPYIRRCGVSSSTNALRWAMHSIKMPCRASNVVEMRPLPRASMRRTCRVTRTCTVVPLPSF